MAFLWDSILHMFGCAGLVILYGVIFLAGLLLIEACILLIKDIIRRIRK